MAIKKIPFNQLGKAGYNRGINRAHVNRIKRDFHEDMVQPAIVSLRDGKYWIVDHQHLSTAIVELNGNDPNTPILCDVKTGLTYEQEADLYYRLNTGTKPLSFNDKLAGRIESKESVAIEFRDVVESCGYVIGGNTKKSLGATSTAWSIFRKGNGKERLTTILTLTHMCWPENQKGVHTYILNGISFFLDKHEGGYQIEQFIKALSPVDPKTIINDSVAFYRQMDSKSFTQTYCTYTEIVKRYNFKLRTNKLTPAIPNN